MKFLLEHYELYCDWLFSDWFIAVSFVSIFVLSLIFYFGRANNWFSKKTKSNNVENKGHSESGNSLKLISIVVSLIAAIVLSIHAFTFCDQRDIMRKNIDITNIEWETSIRKALFTCEINKISGFCIINGEIAKENLRRYLKLESVQKHMRQHNELKLEGAKIAGTNISELEEFKTLFNNKYIDDLRKPNLRPAEKKEIMKNVIKINFKGADLRKVKMRDVKLYMPSFQEAIMNDVEIREGVIIDGGFQSATMENAIFDNVSLENADFTYALIFRSSMENGTDLTGARFMGSDLRETEMYDAKFKNTTFSRADIRGVKFKAPKTNKNTKINNKESEIRCSNHCCPKQS